MKFKSKKIKVVKITIARIICYWLHNIKNMKALPSITHIVKGDTKVFGNAIEVRLLTAENRLLEF